MGSFVENEAPEQILVPECPEAEEADYVLTVTGDSMQPQFSALMTVVQGMCTVSDGIYSTRFKYIEHLKNMGANIDYDKKQAILRIIGVKELNGTTVKHPTSAQARHSFLQVLRQKVQLPSPMSDLLNADTTI